MLLRRKSTYSVVQSSLESIYVCSDMDSNIKFNALNTDIFGNKAEFVPPSLFNYSLPSKGTPEFAFVGRYVI